MHYDLNDGPAAAGSQHVTDAAGLTCQGILLCRKWVEEKARNEALQAKLESTAAYEVVVATSAAKGAGTDARVYLEIYGPDEQTVSHLGPEGPRGRRIGGAVVLVCTCRRRWERGETFRQGLGG